MMEATGYAAFEAGAELTPFRFERCDPGPDDVVLDILFCGICHSDLHMLDNDWGVGQYPMVAGHEIIGRVARVGTRVNRFSVGDTVGVGCILDSCRHCEHCNSGDEQFCSMGFLGTMNTPDPRTGELTRGGFSDTLIVDQNYALRIPENLDPAAAAPLLCAGITTWTALRSAGVGAGDPIAVVGLGGLGHLALKFAHAFGADVTLFTGSPEKSGDARRLGASTTETTGDPTAVERLAGRFKLILDTVSAPHDINVFLAMLKPRGIHCVLGMPDGATPVLTNALVLGSKSLSGQQFGGIRETQEMLDFCGQHHIAADIEKVNITEINSALQRLRNNDVKYRFVVDMSGLSKN